MKEVEVYVDASLLNGYFGIAAAWMADGMERPERLEPGHGRTVRSRLPEYFERQAILLAIRGIQGLKAEGRLPTDARATIYTDSRNAIVDLKEPDGFRLVYAKEAGAPADILDRIQEHAHMDAVNARKAAMMEDGATC